MRDTELVVVTAALCLAGRGFHISMRNSYFENKECFGVWQQKIKIILTLFEGGL